MSRRLLASAFLILACGVTSVRADEPVLLKYKETKGQTRYYKNIQEMKQSQSIMGMKQENSMNQEAIMSRVAEKVDQDGTTTFKIKAERRKVKAEFGFIGKLEFDSKSSERDTSSALGSALTPVLERTTGAEYEVTVDPRGHVTEVKGYAELIADILKDNPLASQFGANDNNSAKLAEQEAFVLLSDKPVKVGDKWETPFEADLPPLGSMKGKMVCTFEGYDKVGDRKTVRIGVTTDVTFELKLDQGGTKVSGTLTTNNSTGTVQFDPEAGCVVSGKRNFSMSGQLTVETGGMTIPVDNQQDQTVEFTLLDKLPE